MSKTINKPWGYYEVLDSHEGFLIKKILVKPKEKLSLQSHKHRSEHWVVVQGSAKVTIDENTPGADGKPAMKLLIRDADGDMYDLNELASASNYRLYTKDVKLDKGLPFTYENLKEHKAIEQATALTNSIKEFVPMSDGVENFVYETFLKLDRFGTTAGNWEVTLPSISNLWTDDINHKTYQQFSFAM